MADIYMSFVESIQTARSLTALAKETRKQIKDYMDTMKLPDGATSIDRSNIIMWVTHYMNGACSLESLNNVMMKLGFADMLKEPPHELEVDEEGKLKVYRIEKEGQ